MKKNLVIAALAFLASVAAHGQFEIKAGGGINFASLSNHPTGSDFNSATGFQFGGGVLIGDKFYVEPGIQFVRHTRAITFENVAEFNFIQNFVKIPVYAGYHLLGHESGPAALRIFAGPAVSIAGQVKEGTEQITKDDLNNAHWLLDAGVGVDLLFLFVELNYEYAFSDYFSEGVFSGESSKHHGFILNAGIHLDF